jgi:hypothetical protein
LQNEFIDTTKRPSVYFYHIPKTGGMSLRAFLADQYRELERCPAVGWTELARTARSDIARYRLVYGHFSASLPDMLAPGVQTFTFLRHPLERTISAIRHTLRDPLFHPLHDTVRGSSLREVIYNDAFMATLRNSLTSLLSFDLPTEEVLETVRRTEARGEVFELGQLSWESSPAKAIATLESYAFVGLMERFEESLLGICQTFNFVPPETMPELNRATDGVDYTRELAAKDIAHVESFLADDLQIYGVAQARFQVVATRSKIVARLLDDGVLRPIAAPCEISLGAPFAGSGWYGPENQASGTVRWSGPNRTAQIYLPIDRGQARRVCLRLWREARLEDVAVSVRDEAVAVTKRNDAGLLNLEIEFPTLPGCGVRLATVVVDSGFVQARSERNDGDLRDLGVMLVSVKLE